MRYLEITYHYFLPRSPEQQRPPATYHQFWLKASNKYQTGTPAGAPTGSVLSSQCLSPYHITVLSISGQTLLQFLSCPECDSIPCDRTTSMSICCQTGKFGRSVVLINILVCHPLSCHRGKDPSMNEMCILQYVLRGIKGVESKSTGNKTRTRLPITPAVLRNLHSQWNKQPFDI